MKPLKYRINTIFEQIGDRKVTEQIKALICWRLRIWHTTLHRKIDAQIGDHRAERTFKHHEMVTICQAMNDIYTFEPPLELVDLYTPDEKIRSTRELNS